MPNISADEARSLVMKARKGNRAARNRLVIGYLPLARQEAARYTKTLGRREAFAITSCALVGAVNNALDSFDTRAGGGLLKYLSRAMRRALRDAFGKRGVVHLPTDMQQKLRVLKAGHSIPTRTRRTLELSMPRAQISLDAPLTNPDADGESGPAVVMDLIPDLNVETPEALYGKAEGRAVLQCLLLSSICRPRDAHVLSLCFGLENGEPLEQAEVAAQTGLSIPVIKAIRAAALKRWRTVPQLHDILRALVSDRPIRRAALPPADGAAKTLPQSLASQRKLNPSQVADIRRRRASGETNRALARAFHVSPATITRVTKQRFTPAA